MTASLYDRIGVDLGRRMKLEEAVAWAAARGVRYIDIQLDVGENAFTAFDDARCAGVRAACAASGVHLGLHTNSAVNVAEYAPLLDAATDAYLRAYVDIAPRLGAEWVVVHAGYHFTSDVQARMEAGLARLQRLADYAERRGARILLENLNKEPEWAEVRYLAHTVEEWRFYYERIASPAFGLSFTANHAHLVPEGVAGFVEAIPWHRVGQVRLADCFRNGHEQHLLPGQGDFDFADLFRRIEGKGYAGHYMNAFGTAEEMHAARAWLVAAARGAGVAA
jgi:sugar phosphate isomerase/epimerase